MARIDYLLFGYRKYKIREENLSLLSTRFLKLGISVSISSSGIFFAKERDRDKILSALSDMDYTESVPHGLLGAFKRYPYKVALILGIALSLGLVILFSSMVWDIKIEGNGKIPDSVIEMELRECGFSIGDAWSSVDEDKIEALMLSRLDEIGWININRRGTVAYVTVMEREIGDNDKNEALPKYGNIVARRDCIIEELTVSCGRPMVKVGDTVKAGDVLVMGALPEESGAGFCLAEANITGRLTEEISVEVNREYELKEIVSEQRRDISFEIFGLSINIFKKYGNLDDDCDIIEEIKVLSLPGDKRLPITVKQTKARLYELIPCIYTDAELVEVALARLRAETAARLEGADLIRMRTEGGFVDGGYVAKNHITILEDVGKISPFEVD